MSHGEQLARTEMSHAQTKERVENRM